MIGAALLCATFVFTSCDNDDDRYLPESAVLQAFSAKYPNAKRTEWESKYGYKKAEFHIGSQELEAWFDAQGNWLLTETDISYNALPQAVKDAFKAGQYAAWKVDDVDMLERPDAPTVYVIEVEKGGQEVELHYTADGTLVKEILDNEHDNEHRPAVTPDAVRLLPHRRHPRHRDPPRPLLRVRAGARRAGNQSPLHARWDTRAVRSTQIDGERVHLVSDAPSFLFAGFHP